MTIPDLIHHHNPVRFSLVSCVTEDSIDSAALATPLDASPPPPPSNTFSIINIVNDDPLPDLKAYPAIAATYTRRRRAQTSPRPVPSSIMMNTIPQQQPIMIHDSPPPPPPPPATTDTTDSSTKSTKFWPRIKRMMTPTNTNTDKMKQLFESMNMTGNTDEKQETSSAKLQEQKSKRWLGRNRARVGPQR